MDIKRIAEQFCICGEIDSISPLGNGLINDTYMVRTYGANPNYVLQRINNSIFQDVDLLQENLVAVTSHIRHKYESAGLKDIDRRVLHFIKLRDNDKTYYVDEDKYWRMSLFISDAYTYEAVTPSYSYEAGKAFGNFESLLSDFPGTLGESIPDFHNMELRASQLEAAISNDRAGRVSCPEVKDIIGEIEKYSYEMCRAERMYRSGILPKRICHCDTKVNNMMFDKDGNVLCVIDLDTVMPSFVFSDFGDFLRTAANTVAEDDPRIELVNFRFDIFRAFAKGYIESAKSFLSPVETENLAYGTALFPFMQAVRFFADYLNGDIYYKTKYPEHNLIRTRNQLALFKSIMNRYEGIQSYINSLLLQTN